MIKQPLKSKSKSFYWRLSSKVEREAHFAKAKPSLDALVEPNELFLLIYLVNISFVNSIKNPRVQLVFSKQNIFPIFHNHQFTSYLQLIQNYYDKKNTY
ncbi:hypothetical protein TTHERM_00951690 (macronuclear) [Tetrahymena thermophila SB210]|uniref:Uncharacterized protein n=1 Tax=Tetrahymena thermophila (strain SB210) TaxID=312017 RepID=Q241Y5_TETTS|nr:hypothetical protein TTHERM_00951690 [Tetrahymena thermophila SB210]EAS02566.1 hypothetical protein TTHERM_00951690 [Tetrahymena thermophila SB210]|eukprot:XP_001022811.1 hypothetical protein TTHERM_00951690 [Tetrahymena thermophila SB210]